jgi:AcrR family transcriptional regulator
MPRERPAPGQRLPAAERRQVIERAASELFAKQGYAPTTLEQIARAAGVTKPVLYRHFRSKKDLHLSLLAAHRDALLRRLVEGLATDAPLAERLPRVAEDWFDYVEENPHAWAMLFRDTTGDPEVQQFHREMQATARATLAGLIRAEPGLAIPEERIEPLAEFVRSAMTGLALWWAEHREVSREVVVSVVVDLLNLGLAPNESA